jgi:hypothetical protein
MSDGVSIDLGSAIPYLIERCLAMFGKDQASRESADFLERHLRKATHDAGKVQIIGMDRYLSIFDIYQPTSLESFRQERVRTDILSLVSGGKDALILGRPGGGKTILVHHAFGQLMSSDKYVPILFPLRWSNAMQDLERFVRIISSGRPSRPKKRRWILLIDGYDEIPIAQRRRVGDVLRDYASLGIGNFYITCREYYNVDDVKAEHWHIAPFSEKDSLGFISAFARFYPADIDPDSLLNDLHAHGFGDFAEHPLLLALVCILKSGPLPTLPRTPLRLLSRAVETLTQRWDSAKGIYRENRLRLDGEDRLRCLMAIAFQCHGEIEPETDVQAWTREFLGRIHRSELSAVQLLREIAQWYGILIPTGDGNYTFAHRTIHDYLAARYWVESGKFSPDRVSIWNTRAAYAACLAPDATQSMVRALTLGDNIETFAECLYNDAAFDETAIPPALDAHFRKMRNSWRHSTREGLITVETQHDFFRICGAQVLHSILLYGVIKPSEPVRQMLVGYSLAELHERREPVPASTWNQLRLAYNPSTTAFQVKRDSKDVVVSVGDIGRS